MTEPKWIVRLTSGEVKEFDAEWHGVSVGPYEQVNVISHEVEDKEYSFPPDSWTKVELVNTRTNPSPPIEPDWKAVVMDMAEFLGALEGSPHLGIQTQLNAREIYRKMDSLIKKHVEDKTTERCITKHTGAKEE
jgi:hypothetical protein